jgi:hypothetical protein
MLSTKQSEEAKLNAQFAYASSTEKDVRNNIKANNKNGPKKATSNKCKCAKMFQEKGSAYKTFGKGKPVYLIKKNNGKYAAYGQCALSINSPEGDFCRIHERQDSSKRILFESLVNDNSGNIELIKTKDHHYFDRMGDCGANKTIKSDTFKFDCIDNHILMLLNHPNAKYTNWLYRCAMHILETGTPVITDNGSTTYTIQKNSETVTTSSLFTLMENSDDEEEEENPKVVKKVSKPKKKAQVVEESESEDEIENEDKKETNSNVSDSESNNDSDSDSESDSDTVSVASSENDDDTQEMNVVPIETHKGQKYFMNPETLKVYELPSEDDEDQKPSELGILVEIAKKYSTLTYDDNHYIISKEISDESKNLDMYLCVLSDKVFDKNTKACLGKLKHGKNGGISISYRTDK